MINESMEYAQYFQPEQEVRIGIHLVDNKFLDDCASIMFIEEDCIHIELDRDVPVGVVMKRGAESVITSLGGWMYCRCRAVLEETLARRELKLRFRGPVIIRQQREYFRWDVYIPLLYSIPDNQQLVSIQEEWTKSKKRASESDATPTMRPHEEGFKVVGWTNREEILPQRVNLSGGGLRFSIREELAVGTLVDLEIFLPLIRPKVIHAVAMVLRTQELQLIRDKHTYYSTAMKFICLDEHDREDLISYLFVEQRNDLQARSDWRR